MIKITWKSAYSVTVPLVVAALFTIMATVTMANAQTSATPGQVTFARDIAPILQNNCQTCHRAGGIAPMSLTTYQQVRTWAPLIKQRVVSRTMPPWFIDRTVGIQHFKNDISLSDQQISTIAKWVDEGAPLGDPKDMPPPKVFDDGSDWQLAKVLGRQPDLIINGPDYTVKAHNQDQWWHPISAVDIKEPRWIMALEVRPSTLDGRKVFHHVIASLVQDETNAPSAQVKVSFDTDNGLQGAAGRPMNAGPLAEYAIGKPYEIYDNGEGKLIMPGARIAWEYHMHSSDKDITSHPQIALYFYPRGVTPKYRTYLSTFMGGTDVGKAYDRGLDIPPNSLSVSQGFTVLRAAARLESYQPHMHMRGKSMSMEAILPDGTTEVLSNVAHYNWKWMTNYIYSDDSAPVLPKGTVIVITDVHDNTKANPDNPNPNQWVGYGGRTVDEMAHAWINVTYITDEDYREYVAKHPRPKSKSMTMGGMDMVGESAP